MADHFPLFNTVKSTIPDDCKELSQEQFEETIAIIKKMHVRDLELVYGLIKAYDITYSDPPSLIGLPFSGKELKSGPKFDMDNMPYVLQNIIYKFALMNDEINSQGGV